MNVPRVDKAGLVSLQKKVVMCFPQSFMGLLGDVCA